MAQQPDPNACTIKDTYLEDKHLLHIVAADPQGNTQDGGIDLDTFIGNVNGALSLGGTNFSSSARKVRISDDGKFLDAEIPDNNGDFSTSSMKLQYNINKVDGKLAVLFAMGLPHSEAHADADTVKAAEKQILNQVETDNQTPDVSKVMTLKIDKSYDMNNPNAEWVRKNLGPAGIANAIELTIKGAVVIGMVVQKKRQGGCVVM